MTMNLNQTTTTNQCRRKRSLFLPIIVALTILRGNAIHVRGYASGTILPLTTKHQVQVQQEHRYQQHHQQQSPLVSSSVSPSLQQTKRRLLQQHVNSNYHPVLSIRGGGGGRSGVGGGTQLNFSNQAFASILAGSIAGAIGVGVAFPLDTLKTKAQVFSQQRQRQQQQNGGIVSSGDGSGTTSASSSGSIESVGMLTLIPMIYKMEGIGGFYGGVRGMMAGQAIIKSVAFSANTLTLDFLRDIYPALSSVTTLLIAACFSGFVTSFLVAPVERIKVMMQASNSADPNTDTKTYSNEFSCIQVVLQNEGWSGLMGRGLGPTLVREIPSYGIYFFLYGILSQLPMAESMGKLAPLVNGALSGMGCWVPVYPIDVVKTLVQNSDGAGDDRSSSAIDVAKELYRDGGVNAFFDGLTPKMLRAAVNHAVTFWMYDLLMANLRG